MRFIKVYFTIKKQKKNKKKKNPSTFEKVVRTEFFGYEKAMK